MVALTARGVLLALLVPVFLAWYLVLRIAVTAAALATALAAANLWPWSESLRERVSQLFGWRPGRYLLITFSYSHYCERARWALDVAQVEYTELCVAPVFNWAVLLLTRNRSQTLPVLITPDNTVLADSFDILWHLHTSGAYDFFPDDATLELSRWIGGELRVRGPVLMLWYQLLRRNPQCQPIMQAAWVRGAPRWQERLFDALLWPFLEPFFLVFPLLSQQRYDASLHHIRDVCASVAQRALASNNNGFLCGQRRITGADISVCSLLMFSVWAPPAEQRICGLQALPSEYRADIESLRATPLGQYVLHTYSAHRARP